MSRLIWDGVGKKLYESGCDRGVLYVASNGTYPTGIAWDGLVSVTEKPSGAEVNKQYANNSAYLSLVSAEDFAATLEAFVCPPAFEVCDGSAELAKGVSVGQQTRKPFGLCYRTKIGNDTDGEDYGYKLHIVYGCIASPSEKAYKTISNSIEANTYSWEISTTPVPVTGFKPTAYLCINSKTVDSSKLTALEDILYGKDAGSSGSPPAVEARLPLPDEIKTLVTAGG